MTTEWMVKWDRRFIALAKHVSYWSKDPSTQVGAVIVDRHRRVVSMGYNGFPRGVEDWDSRYNDRETKYGLVVHAEQNAILSAQRDLDRCTLYVTLSPCRECAKSIIQSGITRVVYDELRRDEYTDAMFAEAGVEMEQVR